MAMRAARPSVVGGGLQLLHPLCSVPPTSGVTCSSLPNSLLCLRIAVLRLELRLRSRRMTPENRPPPLFLRTNSPSNFRGNVVAMADLRAAAQPETPRLKEEEKEPKDWADWLAVATSLYPVYMLVGGVVAFWRPSTFAWFVQAGPNSYSAALGIIMLAMGFTLRIQDLLHVLTERPLAVIFGFAAQYTIMPLLGAGLSRALGLPAELSAGLILMACCPGGTASNVVTYIARGDVPLSILMTICTTFAAVFTTPFLTSVLAGAYVPVDALGLALSTLQVVLAPVVVGACMQTFLPQVVAVITHFAPLVAVLVSSLLASSVFSANVPLLVTSSVPVATMVGSISSMATATSTPSIMVNLGMIGGAVMTVHATGFLLGYVVSTLAGFSEPQRRAISIEVGMQNSSLGVVLATTHFASPLTAIPAAVSAVIMNIMGSGLAVVWRNRGSGDRSFQTSKGAPTMVNAQSEEAKAMKDGSF